MKRFRWRDESGVTLVEILVAVAIIMIGLVAVMQAFPLGTQGMETGRGQSTGVFLAEQKLEQIKLWVKSQGFDNVIWTAPPFNQEGFNSIQGYPGYSRTVIVQPGPIPVNLTTKVVQVQVSYRRVTSTGVFTGGTQVDISTLVGHE